MGLTIKGLKFMVLTAMLVALVPTAGALAQDREAALLASQQWQQEIAAIAANPDAFIAGLVSKWEPVATALGYPTEAWAQEFAAALKKAIPEDLLAIEAATSYDAVRAILQGRIYTPMAVPAGISPLALGDISQDLTFTPVSPCRIWDTRNVGGIIPNATYKTYVVYGDAATIGAQGGNPAGCTAPKGEPVAVAINVTATQGFAGHLRVYPYGSPLPNASFLNFSGSNVANAGIVGTCYLCSYDITVWNQGDTHHLADITGYFYPAEIGTAFELRQGGYDINVATVGATITSYPGVFVASTNGSGLLTTTGGEDVLWMVSANVRRTGGANNAVAGEWKGCYHNVATDEITQMPLWHSETDFYWGVANTSDLHSVQVSSREASMPAGTYNFGFCARNGNTGTGYAARDPYAIDGVKINVIKVRKP